jgi:4-diphosphocytidyl-2-C-methyl-D-erythritol kinase
VIEASAHAKINLGLVVGPRRPDGKHEVETVLHAIDLHDDIALEAADELVIEGFAEDLLVREALTTLARATGVTPAWKVRIEKRIPVAAGLGGGSSDAATALRLANELLGSPLRREGLHAVAAGVGSDVPFFLHGGAQLATGSGTELKPLDLPGGYAVLLVLPEDRTKESTAAVYRDFDARGGANGFAERAAAFRQALGRIRMPRDLAALPPNDLATSPLVPALTALGAFRADVTGAGPAVYGLFDTRDAAESAAEALRDEGRAWVAQPIAGADPVPSAGKMGPALGRGQVVRQRVLVP